MKKNKTISVTIITLVSMLTAVYTCNKHDRYMEKEAQVIQTSNDFEYECLEGNCSNGHGIIVAKNKFKYSGNFKDNRPHGKGKIIHDDGTMYEGDYYNGEYHGKGKYVNRDESYYIGEFNNGEKQGRGIVYLKNGEIVFKGEYKHGNMYHGTLFTPDGEKYTGFFNNGLPNGKGVLISSDGNKVSGTWNSGIYAGK